MSLATTNPSGAYQINAPPFLYINLHGITLKWFFIIKAMKGQFA
jgi:hypothetical protein